VSRTVGIYWEDVTTARRANSRLEGINAKIRLIQRRGYGFRNLDALSAAIYLCLGGITLDLPTER
jgi:transposase